MKESAKHSEGVGMDMCCSDAALFHHPRSELVLQWACGLHRHDNAVPPTAHLQTSL